jgi:threonine dehydrogenase-like Zn-dependent dehydrogenase
LAPAGCSSTGAKPVTALESDRLVALRQLIRACRKGGTISIPGVYDGFVDKMPMGAIFAKGLTLKAGQTQVQKYLKPLTQLIATGAIDTTFIITHRLALDEAPAGYRLFNEKKDGCIKIVMNPRQASGASA